MNATLIIHKCRGGRIKKYCRSFLIMIFVMAAPFSGSGHADDSEKTLTISEGLRIATDNNRIIKIASREKDMSYADTLIARSRYLPSVNASLGQAFLNRQPGAIFNNNSVPTAERNSLSYGVEIRQSLYDFGVRSSQYDASKTAFDAANMNIARMRNLVALDFVFNYFDLLETEKMLSVARSEVERLESHLNTAKSLYSGGVITKNDMLQSEVRLSDARQRLITIKNLRAVNASRINNILSRPLMKEVRVADVEENSLFETGIDGAWDTAVKQRIELKTLDSELKIADLEKTVKTSEYFPEFFARGGYNYAENRYQAHEDNWSLILGINFNIFSGGSTKAEISKIGYKKERLLEQKKKLEEDIKLDVEKAYFELKNAREKIDVTKDAIGQAEENLKINKIKYSEGAGTSTDVLDAITLLTTAETNYYRAVYELKKAHAGIMYAMGVDLVSEYKQTHVCPK